MPKNMKSADPLGHAWCCARTHHGEETRAAGSLENDKGYETYLPRLCTEKVVRGKVVRQWEPLFPRYLFVRLPLRGLWQPARYAKGVAKLISSPSGTPFAVPPTVFAKIREMCGEDRAEVFDRRDVQKWEEKKAMKFETGDAVRVLDGPWASWNGFVEMSKKDRVIVLLSIFGRNTRAEMTREQIELVA